MRTQNVLSHDERETDDGEDEMNMAWRFHVEGSAAIRGLPRGKGKKMLQHRMVVP